MTQRLNDPKYALGPGPWSDEPDHVEFEAHGLPCLIHRNPLGAWCGYAAVPPGHPLHGADFGSVDTNVHGGLSYGGACRGEICHVPKPGEPDNVWWFGFDCSHFGDLIPWEEKFRSERGFGEREDRYRDQAYVTAETIELAQRLRELA